MKRIILIIGALLLGLVVRAQSVTYTCRYWFDQNFAQAATATFSNSTWQAELDVGSLADGLHTLHLHVMDTSMKWSAPQNYLFLKTTVTQPENYVFHHWIDQGQMQSNAIGNGQFLLDVATLDAGLHTLHVMLKGSEYTASQSYIFLKPELTGFDAENWVYHCWFDEDYAHRETDSLGNGNFLLDVSGLEEGLHTLNVILQGNSLTATQSYMFMRVEMIETNSIDMSNLTYSCWFDQDYEQRVTDSLRDGNILLDVADLTDGLHTVNVMLQGGTGTLTSTRTYMFMKVTVDDPSIEQQYHCWFDQDYSTMQTGMLGGGIFQLEVSDLSNGLHIMNVQLEKETRTAPQSYFFYKIPFGGNGLNKWEYCINGDWGNRITTNVVPSVDTLSIVSLLPVPPQPVRSSCFHFHPNGDAPYLNAKNEITLRFWTADDHFIDKSAFYVDEYVSEPIVADSLERNTTVCIPAPRDNQMQWYKVPLVVGDSIAFRTDKACTVQLFAPSGEEVYTATASEALVFGGIHAWEDGDYYLVVHDVTGSGDVICLTNVYVHKYAILAYDVHLVGNGGCSTITFQGNGFNSLLDVYLVNTQNDTIRPMNIGHESNTTTTITFDFNGVELGYYEAVFHFIDENLTIENCITVEEATPFAFDATVSFASQYLRTTSNKYVFQVHNNSNMTAYNVPLLVHVYTPDDESLTRVDIDGFDVKSYISEIFGSHYTDSIDNVIEQKRLTSGDLFGFLEDSNTEYVPAFPYLHYIFITPTLRPNTTETFTIAVKSTNTAYVYMWYPEEWENVEFTENLPRTKSGGGLIGIILKWMCAQNEVYVELGYPPRFPNITCDGDHDPDGGGTGGPSTPVNSLDPNDIHGYLSESGSHYMRQEIQNVQYEIEFENDTTLATAAAHTIIVRDTLDATKFDLNSLAARSVTIGDKRLDLNGEQTFARTLDLRPELYVIAQIEQEYDASTGIIQWTIQSLDPMTMEPTDDPNQGVLPVNYSGNGVGFIDYSINLKQAFADGTEISNRAGIIFDQNDVIMTPTWTNIVDAVKPTSHIENVVAEADNLNFSFVSSDNRSGVWYHTLYYRNDSTEMEWRVKVPKILENSYSLRFDEYQTTEYLVMAVDSAGNREEKDVAEYVHYYDGPEPVCQTYSLMRGWNWWSTNLDITLDELKAAIVEALPGTTVTIKSRTKNTSFNPGMNQWRGTLNSLDVTQMYMIYVSVDCEITLEDMLVDPAEHPVTINNGTNWIAFPISVNMSVDNAFSGFAVDGDNIKSRNNNASYSNGHWRGRLTSLEPGRGYMYMSNAQETRVLTFPASTR